MQRLVNISDQMEEPADEKRLLLIGYILVTNLVHAQLEHLHYVQITRAERLRQLPVQVCRKIVSERRLVFIAKVKRHVDVVPCRVVILRPVSATKAASQVWPHSGLLEEPSVFGLLVAVSYISWHLAGEVFLESLMLPEQVEDLRSGYWLKLLIRD